MGKIIWRAARTAVALGFALSIKTFFNDPNLIWITPLLPALGKYLRVKYPKILEWLPF